MYILKLVRYILVFLLPFLLFGEEEDSTVAFKAANEVYLSALHATSYLERVDGLNRSLAAYLELQAKLGEGYPALLISIGNNFFEFGEFSLALLYYKKAIKVGADLSGVSPLIRKTEENLGIQRSRQERTVNGLRRQLSSSVWMISTALALFLAASSLLWTTHERWRRYFTSSVYLFSSILLLLLGNLLLLYYTEPLYAMVIKTSRLEMAHGKPVVDVPVLPGTEVEVVALLQQKGLAKINKDGRIYMIPTRFLRPI